MNRTVWLVSMQQFNIRQISSIEIWAAVEGSAACSTSEAHHVQFALEVEAFQEFDFAVFVRRRTSA